MKVLPDENRTCRIENVGSLCCWEAWGGKAHHSWHVAAAGIVRASDHDVQKIAVCRGKNASNINNFPIDILQSDLRISDYKSNDISTNMPIQCKACSWRCQEKIEEQRHEHALHCICNMHILWYLLWPLVFFPNKSSLDFLFIFPVSRPVLTLLSPPGVTPRSLESAASLSHVAMCKLAKAKTRRVKWTH